MIDTVIYKALKNDPEVNELFDEIVPGVLASSLEKNKLYLSYGLVGADFDYAGKGSYEPYSGTYNFIFEVFGLVHSSVTKASVPVRKVLDTLVYTSDDFDVSDTKISNMYNDSKLYDVGTLHSRVIECDITIYNK